MDNDELINTEQVPEKEGPVQPSSEFVIGLVTFIMFVIFMSLWMYFSTE
jgi:hypothetical protein